MSWVQIREGHSGALQSLDRITNSEASLTAVATFIILGLLSRIFPALGVLSEPREHIM
jgi:hypothetical protein